MRLFGIYKGHVYLIISEPTFQGFSTYRDITPAIGYKADGFSIPLNTPNIDIEYSAIENWYEINPISYRGIHAVRVAPNGDIKTINRWMKTDKDSKRYTDILEHSSGNIAATECQWFTDDNDTIHSMISVLKFYNPETIDEQFISNLRFMTTSHETTVIYKIAIDDFMMSIYRFMEGANPLQLSAQWEKIEINMPIEVRDIDVKEIPEFNVTNVVYWNGWERDFKDIEETLPKETAPPETVEKPEKKPRLVEDSEDKTNVA